MIWAISYKTKKYNVKHYEKEDNEGRKQIHPHLYKSWLSINFPLYTAQIVVPNLWLFIMNRV